MGENGFRVRVLDRFLLHTGRNSWLIVDHELTDKIAQGLPSIGLWALGPLGGIRGGGGREGRPSAACVTTHFVLSSHSQL
jgi:hypothetical protein